ncbi:thymidylate synthase [Saliphagus infecundisoli]|uniref:Thymidylate synthase n=1 Tax=Saliphagus infecundisoli TaxID=1849069 RepID=A0ABD5QH19_9EURY|nr:thymidylate synthase [Saliphagus infecundisoli]
MRQYLDLVETVLSEGVHKPNRTGVDTVSAFSTHYEVDLAEGYPLLTTKRMDDYRWNSMLHELCWYLSGEEHIRELREETGIWDAWADDEGRVDTAYGRFWRRFPVPEAEGQLPGEAWAEADHRWVTEEADGRKTFDQLQYVIDTIEESPNSRRLVVNAWHPANAAVSTLPPCHYTFVFNVAGGRLNCQLTQRSGDVALGIPFNVAAYALLARLIAERTGYEPGTFAHTVVDAHAYCGRGDRGEWYAEHLPELRARVGDVTEPADYLAIREWLESEAPVEPPEDEGSDHVPNLLTQLSREPKERPTLELATTSLEELSPEDVTLSGYESHGPLSFSVAE